MVPLMKLMFCDVPEFTKSNPGTSGVGTLFGCAPSNESERVAVSPMEIVSRSSDAVKFAARADELIAAIKSKMAAATIDNWYFLKRNFLKMISFIYDK